ncbi:MAG: SDR family NAD(P)-dependent oxidoreductase, partial [Pseudomonadota bacterium]
MKGFKDKTAIVTGAASGIGKALAKQCILEGMQVVLADIDAITLTDTATELSQLGQNKILTVITDVTCEKDIKALRKTVIKEFGVPHLLFNNAGVGGTAEFIWQMPIKRFKKVLDVNLHSIMYSIHHFVPLMLESQQACHIINTVSMAAFYTSAYFSNYQVSKQAALVLSECLHHDLKAVDANI